MKAGTIKIPIIQGDKPIKGVDYWTDSDKKEIIDDVEKEYNDNHISKIEDFNTNAEENLKHFNDNADEKNRILDSTATDLISVLNSTSEKNVKTLEETGIIEKEKIEKISETKKEELETINNTLNTRIESIEDKLPAQASNTNQLADKDFVNSSISTATATFKGTFDSLLELEAEKADINDYGNVKEKDELGNEYYNRYTFDGKQWIFNFKINTTTFTAVQWEAINSDITKELTKKLIGIENGANKVTKTSELENDSNYVKNTDFATSNNSGVVKTGNGVQLDSGMLAVVTKTIEEYSNYANTLFISKGTLENVLKEKIGSIETALDTIEEKRY